MNLDFSPVERILLANQCKILEKLCPDEAEYYLRWRQALEGGFSLHYDDGVEWAADELTPDECREVLDVLDMYAALQRGYQKLDDISGINKRDLRFDGYDGNNEYRHLDYAGYFIHKLGRYDYLQATEDLNSHCPMRELYRRMLEVWRPLRGNQLNKEQIESVLAAMTHPSNR